MWKSLAWGLLLTSIVSSRNIPRNIRNNSTIFQKDHVIFTSNHNITRLLVPADDNKYLQTESSDIPSIFFTISDPKLEGGSCIYVLEGLAAYEVLEGGRDSTCGNGLDKNIYFGAKDGIYKYYPESLSAKRFSKFKDDIIQLQKANAVDAIYILNSEYKLFKIENNGTHKSKVKSVPCALEFVLDSSNNIYYIGCEDHMLHIVKADGTVPSLTASVIEDFRDIKLLRPAFIMEDCVPYFGDGVLYILHSNGSSERKDFSIEEKPSAYSVDAGLYLVAALNGKIYEFNVMEVMLTSMFGVNTEWPSDVTKIVMSIMEKAKDNVVFVLHKK